MKFPNELITILKYHRNSEMTLCHEKALYIIFEDESAIKKLNIDINIAEGAPGFTAFATDGGNELFVYDKTGAIYMMPMIGMSIDDAWKIADTWYDFNTIIQKSAQQRNCN
jgi:hypothetical protein